MLDKSPRGVEQCTTPTSALAGAVGCTGGNTEPRACMVDEGLGGGGEIWSMPMQPGNDDPRILDESPNGVEQCTTPTSPFAEAV